MQKLFIILILVVTACSSDPKPEMQKGNTIMRTVDNSARPHYLVSFGKAIVYSPDSSLLLIISKTIAKEEKDTIVSFKLFLSQSDSLTIFSGRGNRDLIALDAEWENHNKSLTLFYPDGLRITKKLKYFLFKNDSIEVNYTEMVRID